jgi:hypothetical protein
MRFRTPVPQVLVALASLTVFVHVLSTGARAEVQITGGADAMKVDAKEVSVEDLLIALNKAFGLDVRSSADLSRTVSGTFAGSLQQVVSRVLSLEGYNFIAETSAHRTAVAVYDVNTAPGGNVTVPPKAAVTPPGLKQPPPTPETAQRVGRALGHGGPLNNGQLIQFFQRHGRPQ